MQKNVYDCVTWRIVVMCRMQSCRRCSELSDRLSQHTLSRQTRCCRRHTVTYATMGALAAASTSAFHSIRCSCVCRERAAFNNIVRSSRRTCKRSAVRTRSAGYSGIAVCFRENILLLMCDSDSCSGAIQQQAYYIGPCATFVNCKWLACSQDFAI
jgi:hypothetical protein